MPKTLRVVVAAFLTVLALASIGAIWVKDRSKTPAYCNTCHVVQPYYKSWASSEYPAAVHAKVGIACQSCHARPLRQSVREFVTYYITQDYKEPLQEVRVPKEDCIRCHGGYETLAELTQDLEWNFHNSHLGQIECRLCHKMHKVSVEYCAQCHKPKLNSPLWTTP